MIHYQFQRFNFLPRTDATPTHRQRGHGIETRLKISRKQETERTEYNQIMCYYVEIHELRLAVSKTILALLISWRCEIYNGIAFW